MMSLVDNVTVNTTLIDKLIAEVEGLGLPINPHVLGRMTDFQISILQLTVHNLEFELDKLRQISWRNLMSLRSMASVDRRVLKRFKNVSTNLTERVEASRELTKILRSTAKVKVTATRIERVRRGETY